MPELPEVETVRRGLQREAVGRHIESVEVGRERTVRRTSAAEVIARLTGTTMTGFDRRGKYLIGHLDSGDDVMIHLRMSGQVLIDAPSVPRPAHSHVVAHLAADARSGLGSAELRFVDPRTFGEVVVFDPTEVARVLPELARLGVDPIADDFTPAILGRLLDRPRQIKGLLLDQHVIAGLGNIYTDEVLHAVGVHPLRLGSSLPRATVTALCESILTTLRDAIEAGGSTLRDAQYVGVDGAGGSFQERFTVYGRTGERCRTCGRGWVTRLAYGGRGAHFCPVCQRAPRS